MSEQMNVTDADDEEQVPDYRVSHLMDELADAFSERGMVQEVAPLGKGGIKPRVQNRVTFQYGTSEDPEQRTEARQDTEDVLETEAFAWTTGGEPREIIVLGRAIRDLRELRKGDRIHVNKRRGPFKVYRVMDHAPEVLQRSDPAVTVELANADTDTDWMLVQWQNEQDPWAYCKTKDKHAKGGFRYRKVERAERLGRIGPLRMYAPSHDHISEGYQDTVLEMVQSADEDGGLGDVHPSDVTRVENLMVKPAAEVFSPEDADTIRDVMDAVSEYHEREADALNLETDEDKEHAAHHQELADDAAAFASAFNLAHMDAVEDTEEQPVWVCEDCAKAFTDKYKYPTHRRDCPERGDGEQTGN